MRSLSFILLIFISFFLFACTQSMDEYSQVYAEDDFFNPTNIIPNQYDPNNPERLCTPGPCACFVCEKARPFFGIFDSLAASDAKCWLETDCNINDYSSALGSSAPLGSTVDDKFIKSFMIGAPSAQFAEANAYCENRLDMSVKWLYGTNEDSYASIEPDRAQCYLEYGVIPVYLLYTQPPKLVDGTIEPRRELDLRDVDRAREIARALNGQGPVIITAEAEFNSSNGNDISIVVDQIEAMKSECTNCLIALAPQYNDTEGVKLVFDRLSSPDRVDIVAYGINTHSPFSNADCTGPAIFREATKFSEHILFTHRKPTLITYMYFKPNVPTPNKGCEWTDYTISDPSNPQNAYTFFFSGGAMAKLVTAGTIGAAIYAYDPAESDPFYCPAGDDGKNSCAVGRNENSLKSFFSPCQNFKLLNITDPNQPGGSVLRPSGEIPINFPYEKDAYCPAHASNVISFLRGSFQNSDITRPIISELRPQREEKLSCDSCARRDVDRPFPFAIEGHQTLETNQNMKNAYCASEEDKSNEQNVPSNLAGRGPIDYQEVGALVDFYSDKRDLDPYMVRALISIESSFDKCELSFFVPIQNNCNPLDITYGTNIPSRPVGIEDISTMEDYPVDSLDRTNCNVYIDQQINGELDRSPPGTGRPTMKPCAYGLMQSIEYSSELRDKILDNPEEYAFLDKREARAAAARPEDREAAEELTAAERNTIQRVLNDDVYTEDIQECYGKDGKFNPFDPDDSACWGTFKLRKNLDTAKTIITGKERDLNLVEPDENGVFLPTAPIDGDKKRIVTYYVAHELYSGIWNVGENATDPDGVSHQIIPTGQTWIDDFVRQKTYTAEAVCACERTDSNTGACLDLYEFSERLGCEIDSDGNVMLNEDAAKCNGQSDFLVYMEQCVYDVQKRRKYSEYEIEGDPVHPDAGMKKIKIYKTLSEPFEPNPSDPSTGTGGCRHSTCPSPSLRSIYLECKALIDPAPPGESCWKEDQRICDLGCVERSNSARSGSSPSGGTTSPP